MNIGEEMDSGSRNGGSESSHEVSEEARRIDEIAIVNGMHKTGNGSYRTTGVERSGH